MIRPRSDDGATCRATATRTDRQGSTNRERSQPKGGWWKLSRRSHTMKLTQGHGLRTTDNMPKRTDLRKILLISSGPIVIGQACEFDYSGTQACHALRDDGYTVVLVNSNPATIMTDPGMA